MNWFRIRRWLLIAVIVLVMAFVSASWFIGGAIVAPANRIVGPPPGELAIESFTISSDSGSTLAAWYLPSPNATATVVLLHPIRADRRSMLTRAKMLYDSGYSTLLIDLQAHGESIGPNVTAGFREQLDVRAAVSVVRSRNPGHKIGVIGRSLGGAATVLASPLDIDALVLESVYPSITEAVHNRISMRLGPLHHVVAPVLLVQLQPRLGISLSQLRPIDRIADVDCPILVAAGDLDRHTTLAETKRLHDAAREPKKLVIFAGAAHTDLLAYDSALYKNEVVGFLDAHLRPSHSAGVPAK